MESSSFHYCQDDTILFVANRKNYSRWAYLYLLDMLQLPDFIVDAFKRGNFSVRRAPGKFNGIWSDMETGMPRVTVV